MSLWESTKDNRIKKRNKQYWARFSRLGVRVEQCLFLSENERGAFTKAQHKTNEIENLLRNKQDYRDLFTLKKPKSVLCGELWEDFIQFGTEGSKLKKKKPWRLRTLSEYRFYWDRYFKPFWENKLPSEIDESSWKEYLGFARSKSSRRSNLVMFNHHKYFKTFCTYMVDHGYLAKAPSIWNPDPEKEDDDGAGLVYPPQIIKAMIKSAEPASFKLYVSMGALMGMRCSEITQLRKDRIDLGSKLIRLKARDVKTGSKTGKGRSIPIPDSVWDQLYSQYHSTTSNYLFPNFRKNDGDRPMHSQGFQKNWEALREHLGITQGRFHDLRHTYCTNLFMNPKINPVLACQALGMSMQTAESVYIHPRDEHYRLITENFDYSEFV